MSDLSSFYTPDEEKKEAGGLADFYAPEPEKPAPGGGSSTLDRLKRHAGAGPGGVAGIILGLAEAAGGDGAGGSVGMGLAAGGSGGFLGEARGALEAAKNLFLPPSAGGGATVGDAGRAYVKGRAEGDAEVTAAAEGKPGWFKAGQAGGAVALGAAAGPVGSSALTAAGTSDADLTKGELGKLAGETAAGTAIGLGAKFVGEAGGKLAHGLATKALGPHVKAAGDAAAAGREWAGPEAMKAARVAAERAAVAGGAPASTAPAKGVVGQVRDVATAAGIDYVIGKVTKDLDVPIPFITTMTLLNKVASAHPSSKGAIAAAAASVLQRARESGLDKEIAKTLLSRMPLAAAQTFAEEILSVRSQGQ